jgi:flagellar motor switch protein FliN/FliY
MAKEATVAEPEAQANDTGASKTQAQSVEYPDAGENVVSAEGSQFDILLDMGVTVTVALGHAEIPVRRLLQLGPGAVLELGKSVEAPVDLYLQGMKFAEGDVVVVDDHFGIRIKRIMGVQQESQE